MANCSLFFFSSSIPLPVNICPFCVTTKQLTIGIHSGEVVTGVIGKRMPRYCLFGNTVNLTSRTETTGEPGRINVTENAYNCLRENKNHDTDFKFTYRGPVLMKGRAEPMKIWFLNRKTNGLE